MTNKNVNKGWELELIDESSEKINWWLLILLLPSLFPPMFLLGKFFIVPCYDFVKEFDGFMEFIEFVYEIQRNFAALLLDYIPVWILLPTLILCFICTLNSILFDTRN